jgi:anti-sigma B factor antagonist
MVEKGRLAAVVRRQTRRSFRREQVARQKPPRPPGTRISPKKSLFRRFLAVPGNVWPLPLWQREELSSSDLRAAAVAAFRPHGKPSTDRLGCMVFCSIPSGFCFEARMATHRRIDVSKVGDVSVVKFQDRKILDEASIQELGQELFGLVEQDNRKSILLNFTGVEFLSSAALGKLITLDRKIKSHKGRLKLCEIRPEILEVFQITKLNKVFDIRTDEAEAIAAFA